MIATIRGNLVKLAQELKKKNGRSNGKARR